MHPYLAAVSASKASADSTISSARFRPTLMGSNAKAPPPGTSPSSEQRSQ